MFSKLKWITITAIYKPDVTKFFVIAIILLLVNKKLQFELPFDCNKYDDGFPPKKSHDLHMYIISHRKLHHTTTWWHGWFYIIHCIYSLMKWSVCMIISSVESNLSCQIPSTSSHHHAPLQQKSICFISPTFIFYIGKNEVSTPEKNKLPSLLIHRVDYDESPRVGGCFFAFFINVLWKNSFFLLSSSNSTFSWQLSSSNFLFTKHFIS